MAPIYEVGTKSLDIIMMSLPLLAFPKGQYLNDVRKILGILDPLPPLVRIFTQPISTIVRKIGHFFPPPSPLGANVINGSPLTVVHVTRVKRSAFYCVEEGVLRSGKKRNFYSCILQPPECKGYRAGQKHNGGDTLAKDSDLLVT